MKHRKSQRPLRVEELEQRAVLATFNVNSFVDNLAADNLLSLREAINAVNVGNSGGLDQGAVGQITGTFGSNDTIQFSPALNGQTITLGGTRLNLTRNVKITGPGANQLTINGNNASQIFFVDGRTNGSIRVVISGLTLKGGNANGSGGTVTGGVDNSVRGGAIFNDSGLVSIESSYFTQNSATFAGAIYNFGNILDLNNSTIYDNSASAATGGVTTNGGTLVLTNCTVSGNDAQTFNGGVNNAGGTVIIAQSTIVDNTIVNANGSTAGAGVYTNAGTTTIENSVVAGNLDLNFDQDDIGGLVNVTGNNNFVGSTGSGGLVNGVNGNIVMSVPVSTLVSALANNGGPVPTHLPLPNSPLLDKGSNADAIGATDQRGAPRIVDGPDVDTTATIDIGAVEYQGAAAVTFVSPGDSRIGVLSVTANVTWSAATTLKVDLNRLNPSPAALVAGTDYDQLRVNGSITLGNAALDGVIDSSGVGILTASPNGPDTFTILTYTGVRTGKFASGDQVFIQGRKFLINYDDLNKQIVLTKALEVAANLVVDNNAADLDDGNYTAGNLTLREAVALANADPDTNTITFANGLGPIDLTVGQLTLAQNVLIDGGGDITVRRSNAGGTAEFRVLLVNSGITADLRGLTISNGKSDSGAGISNYGTLTVSQSTLSGNSTTGNGGGIYNGGILTVSQSTLASNSAGNVGGGITNDATLTIIESTLSGNSASNLGGGIYNTNTLTVTQSTLSGNSTTVNGGGIYNTNTLTVSQSTLSGNSAANAGGGLFNVRTLMVSQSTITGNSATVAGGGGIWTSSNSNTFTTLYNTIVAGNFVGTGTTPNDLANKNVEAGSSNNLIGEAGSAGGLINGTNGNKVGFAVASVLNTMLADNGGPTKTHALVVNSPAINAGSNTHATIDGQVGSTALTTDQRGSILARIFNTTVDIGAFESQTVSLVVDNNAADLDDGNYTAGNLTLREAVTLANAEADANTITFANGLGPIVLTQGRFNITESVTITGLGVNKLTLNGNNASQIFFIDGAASPNTFNVTIQDLTMTDGNALGGQSDLDGNDSGLYGGALLNNRTNLTLNRVAVTSSNAVNGGGLYNWQGGGMMNVNNSTIAGNDASGSGGGFFSWDNGSILNVSNSTLSGNTAGNFGGGAITVQDGTATIVNSTLSGNSTTGHAGAIYNFRSTVNVVNSTLTGNRADSDGNAFGSGGGISGNSNASTLTSLFNTIVAGNLIGTGTTPSDIAGQALQTASFNNLIGDAGSAGGLTNGTSGNKVGFAVASVLNTTLANNGGLTKTHALVANSPAINAGSNANIPSGMTTDQRGVGFARVFGGTVDIGAVEQAFAPTSFTLSPNLTTPSSNQPLTMTVNLTGSPLPTGTVTLYVNDIPRTPTTLSFGQVQITLNGLPVGLHKIFARYSGDANYAAADSAVLNQQVFPQSDVNRSGAVEINDILAAIFMFNTYATPIAVANLPAGPPFPDASGDGQFDINDLLRIIFDFNQTLVNPEGEAAPPPLHSPALSSLAATDAVFTNDIDWLWPELLSPKRRRS